MLGFDTADDEILDLTQRGTRGVPDLFFGAVPQHVLVQGYVDWGASQLCGSSSQDALFTAPTEDCPSNRTLFALEALFRLQLFASKNAADMFAVYGCMAFFTDDATRIALSLGTE